MVILAIDPGKQKFGYALLTAEKKVIRQGIGKVNDFLRLAEELVATFNIETVVIGDRTGSNEFCAKLKAIPTAQKFKIELIGEDGSSCEGRRRFLEANRKGWRRLLPIGLQSPWLPYDDYVAAILGERYLDRQ